MEDKMKDEPSCLYDEICLIDIIAPIKDKLANGSLKMRPDFRIYPDPIVTPLRPWINAAHCEFRNCSIWSDTFFGSYQLIPNGCRNCWKLAVKPKTIEDLFKVYDFQKTMPSQASKCGIEKRGYTGNLGGYAAFWYSDLYGGLKKARALFEVINTKLDIVLGKGHGLFLKRGCTEMENYTVKAGLGGAENWDLNSEHYDRIERLVAPIFVNPPLKEYAAMKMPWFMDNHVKRMWIEHAFEHGDATVLKYTNTPLMPQPNRFNGSVHSHIDFKTTRKEFEDESNSTDIDECFPEPDSFKPVFGSGGSARPKIALI